MSTQEVLFFKSISFADFFRFHFFRAPSVFHPRIRSAFPESLFSSLISLTFRSETILWNSFFGKTSVTWTWAHWRYHPLVFSWFLCSYLFLAIWASARRSFLTLRKAYLDLLLEVLLFQELKFFWVKRKKETGQIGEIRKSFNTKSEILIRLDGFQLTVNIGLAKSFQKRSWRVFHLCFLQNENLIAAGLQKKLSCNCKALKFSEE